MSVGGLLAAGALVLDMSSSNPVDTQKLAHDLAASGVERKGLVGRGEARDHLLHAEEAAKGYDPAQSRLPQPGQQERKYDKPRKPRRTFRLEQHQRRERCPAGHCVPTRSRRVAW